ncbi:hypothetical protein TNCV_863131 [Trichonephila clavipes]|nr:hypothetical protein TNCV_863131 [Trichonephila clavipes]
MTKLCCHACEVTALLLLTQIQKAIAIYSLRGYLPLLSRTIRDVISQDVIDSSNFEKHPYGHQVAKSDANLAVLLIFRQVPIGTPF